MSSRARSDSPADSGVLIVRILLGSGGKAYRIQSGRRRASGCIRSARRFGYEIPGGSGGRSMSVAYVPRDRVAIVEFPARTPLDSRTLWSLREAMLEGVFEETDVVLIREADAYWAASRDVVSPNNSMARWIALVR